MTTPKSLKGNDNPDKPPVKKRRTFVDWDDLKSKFLASDRDLYQYSQEYTQNPDNPRWTTLQKIASQQGWMAARDAQSVHTYIEAEAKSEAVQVESRNILIESRRKLLDANTTISRHVDIADSFINIYLDVLPAIKRAVKEIDWDDLATSDPKTFISCLKDLNTILSSSIEIERKAMGLADFKMQLDTTSTTKVDLTEKIALLREKDDRELIQEYIEALKK